jgi:hypothetical protein
MMKKLAHQAFSPKGWMVMRALPHARAAHHSTETVGLSPTAAEGLRKRVQKVRKGFEEK